MPDVIARSTSGIFVSVRISQESRNPGKEFLEIGNRQSTFGNSESGGIAQLVERQLCKLEVRGSNPLASKAFKAWRQFSTRREDYRITSGSVIACLQSFE